MRFKEMIFKLCRMPMALNIITGVIIWLMFMLGLHFWLNIEHGHRRNVRMGYMPVVTSLACPLLDYSSRRGNGIRFEAVRFNSFSEITDAFRDGKIEAAFIIAPLAIFLGQQEEDIRVVYVGNRHESTLVVNKSMGAKRIKDLAGKTMAVPIQYSGHNLFIRRLMESHGLADDIRIVEMNPPDMAAALSIGSIDAYCVGEPFAAQTIKNGKGSVLSYVEEYWDGFICNVLIVRAGFMERNPEVTRLMIEGAVRCGMWAEHNIAKAAEIVSGYWNQPRDLVEFAMTRPLDRVIFDQYVPEYHQIKELADLMVRFGLISDNDISGLIDDSFARQVKWRPLDDIDDILPPIPENSPDYPLSCRR